MLLYQLIIGHIVNVNLCKKLKAEISQPRFNAILMKTLKDYCCMISCTFYVIILYFMPIWPRLLVSMAVYLPNDSLKCTTVIKKIIVFKGSVTYSYSVIHRFYAMIPRIYRRHSYHCLFTSIKYIQSVLARVLIRRCGNATLPRDKKPPNVKVRSSIILPIISHKKRASWNAWGLN